MIILKPNKKYEVEIKLNERKEENKMYFIKLDKENRKKLEEGRIRRAKIRKILIQPKGEKYYMLYSGLCSYAVKHGNKINYRTKGFIDEFYKDNKKILKHIRICEIIEGFKMLNLIGLININGEYIKINYYRDVYHMEAIKQFRKKFASR